jgi:hypothetical protein
MSSGGYSVLERLTFFQGERVRFRDHRDHVDDIRQLLQHDNVDRFQSVLRGELLGDTRGRMVG